MNALLHPFTEQRETAVSCFLEAVGDSGNAPNDCQTLSVRWLGRTEKNLGGSVAPNKNTSASPAAEVRPRKKPRPYSTPDRNEDERYTAQLIAALNHTRQLRGE